MKPITTSLLLAVVLLACDSQTKTEDPKVAAATTTEATQPAAEAWKAVDTATANRNWYAYMTPGEAHKMLAESAGEWNADITMWMEPGAEATKSKGTMSAKMVMGGRYQLANFKGDFMGAPMEGMSTSAYDNAEKKYINTWIDNMGTGIMTMKGEWDAAAKAVRYKGRMICPANGQECDMREDYQIIDKDTHLMTMYGPDMKTGKEYKTMEIKYTRKK